MIEFLSDLPYKTYIGLFLCSLFATNWLTPKANWLARGLGLLNISRYAGAPTLGGLAVGIPFIVGISLLLLLKNQVSENIYMVPLHMRGLFFGSSLALGLGITHDILHLNRYVLAVLHTLLAGLAYYYGFHLEVFPPDTHLAFTVGNIALTLLWIVSFVKFFDFYNRHHWTFTHFSLLLISFLLLLAFLLDHYRTIVICSLLSGSLVSILSYDKSLRPNLGSTGTFPLGFILAVTTLQSQLVTNLYSPLVFATAAALLSLLISLKNPIRQLQSSRRQDDLIKLRSLNHFRQALSLKMELAQDDDARWHLLCLGAEAFDYDGICHCSSIDEQIYSWGHTVAQPNQSLPLRCSGGHIHIFAPRQDAPTIQAYFASLVEVYDDIREKEILDNVQQRKNNLRVVLVNRYYGGTSATGQIIEELAEDLQHTGVAVSVITGSLSYEKSELLPGKNELLNGIHIYRLPATYFGRSSSLNRIMDFVFFYLFSLMWIIKTPSSSYTHIITFTDPPLIALNGYVAQRLKHWKFIYNIQDLYPDTALALNAMNEGLLYRSCSWVNMLLLSRADTVIAISEKIATRIHQQINTDARIAIIPNWADGEKIKIANKSQAELRQELQLDDILTLVYAGNMGLAQEIDVLIELIDSFAHSTDIQFVFMGGGVRKSDIAEAAKSSPNVHLVDYQDKESLCDYLSLADMGIVTLAQSMEGLAIPTRTYTYLAVGLPLLIIARKDSELSKFSDLDLGVHFPPDKTNEIVAFLKGQIEQRGEGRREAIRAHFIAHYERRLQTSKYRKLLEEI